MAMPTPSEDVRAAIASYDLVAFVQRDGVPLVSANRRYWTACCPLPGHEDRTPSFRVYTDGSGWWCFGCQRGGSAVDYVAARMGWDPRRAFPQILTVLGLTPGPRALLPALPPQPAPVAPTPWPSEDPTAIYPYHRADGTLRYQVLRWVFADGTKTFRQRRPEGQGWARNVRGVEPLPYRLPEVLAADPDAPVLVVEGEKDVEAAYQAGQVATCNSGGAGSWTDALSPYLQGRLVVCVPDNDAAGQRHMADVAASVAPFAQRVVTLSLPDLPPGGDLSDYLTRHTPAELVAQVATALTPPEDPMLAEVLPPDPDALPPAATADLRPVIDGTDEIHRVRDAILAALAAANDPPSIFQRGRALVTVVEVPVGGARTPQLEAFGPGSLRPRISETARLVRYTRRGTQPMDATGHQLDAVLSTPRFPFPPLDGLTEVPVVRPDGTLHATPGYDPLTRLIYHPAPGLVVPPVADSPTAAEVDRARALLLDDLLIDFPFSTAVERANAVALFLLPFVRPLIAGPTPLHLIESPTPGSGKSLLAELLLTPALGNKLVGETDKTDEDETAKWITAKLHSGAPALWIDNVKSGLNNSTLASALTVLTWSGRILGATTMFQAPMRCVWVATANNPTLSTELARRTIRIRIDPKEDRPQLRTGWKHPDLRGWVAAHRGDLVWAALTLARAWWATGCPAGAATPLGSYEQWTAIMGGILDVAGIYGFLDNLMEVYDLADSEGAIWRAFVEAWWEKHGDKKVGIADLFPLAQDVEGFDLGKANTERGQRTAFGRALKRQRDRIYDKWRITFAGVEHQAAQWALVPQGAKTGELSGEHGNFGEHSATPPLAHIDDPNSSLYGDQKNVPQSSHVPPTYPCGDCGETTWSWRGTAWLCGTCGTPATWEGS